ncbi:NUDIX hydrolase [Chelatococcus reniformis]|uniref:NUDIX hydrolase n=1 Tax=Chelatococcus reniformis TaxID=1494448 RepID=A0A916U8Z9_9HYPH|nr:NUDIX hydrolase [Chelatococcus reniformis]GGC64937.1 hypothetical protein GCM10010994_24420 [Chelatococcus reniformis]
MQKRQVAALPYHRKRGVKILLITSKETRRAIIPKGWPKKKKKEHAAAAKRARREAGLKGKVGKQPIGVYSYWKRGKGHYELCEVAVYPLAVTRLRKRWRDMKDRRMRWFPPDDAALLIDEPDLSTLIRQFAKEFAGKRGKPKSSKPSPARGRSNGSRSERIGVVHHGTTKEPSGPPTA